MTLATLVLCSFLLSVVVFVAQAEERKPVPESQWSPSTALWLARAQVAEAGWTGHVDHDAIAWVLARRWRAAPPGTRFETVILQYCNSLDEHRPRAPWLRTLGHGQGKPEGWPHGTNWSLYEPRWREILERTELWFAGEVADPTDGAAAHWDSRDATPPKGCRLIDLNTRNAFYRCGP